MCCWVRTIHCVASSILSLSTTGKGLGSNKSCHLLSTLCNRGVSFAIGQDLVVIFGELLIAGWTTTISNSGPTWRASTSTWRSLCCVVWKICFDKHSLRAARFGTTMRRVPIRMDGCSGTTTEFLVVVVTVQRVSIRMLVSNHALLLQWQFAYANCNCGIMPSIDANKTLSLYRTLGMSIISLIKSATKRSIGHSSLTDAPRDG